MNRILSFFLIFYVLIQSIGNIMANPISVSPLPLPIDGHGQQPVPLPHPIDPNPIHPVVPHKLKVHSEIGLLLIEDDVTAVKYVTTLDSRGNRMAGSSTQVIFGFPQPTGQMKPITWYSHGTNTDVQHISDLSPAEAFAGVTDAHGSTLLQGTSGMDIPPAGPVNPVFSPKAWQEFSTMPVGGTHTISVTEQLTNGAERQLDTRVTKRAHLRLSQAAPECKSEVVDGMDGQVCTLRTIAGQHQATSAGDMRFTLRAQFPLEAGRFRIANNWHHLGEPVTIAEFANGRTLDLFIPARSSKAGAPAVHMAQRFEAQFFSLSRQGMGDKLSLQMDHHNSVAPQPPVLGRADLLLIEDLPTARQYVTTLGGTGPQRIFGELNGSQGVKWYTTFQQGISGMNPLVRVSQLQPANYFKGIANGIGQLSPSVVRPTYEKGYIFPVFNDQAFNALAGSAMGQQQRLSLQGEYESGTSAPYYLNVNKKSHLKLQLPANNHCAATEVEGAKGFICPLRLISGQGDYNGTGDLRFNLNAKLPFALQQHARYRVGQAWHPVNQSITMAEFGSGQQLELFVPQDEQANGLVIGVEGHFHSASQMADSFNIAMRTRLSPVAGLKQKLTVIPVRDEPTQQSLFTTIENRGIEVAGGVANGLPAPMLKLKNMPKATMDEVTPVQWFVSEPEPAPMQAAQRTLSSTAISHLLQGGQLSAQVKATLQDGQRVEYGLDIQAAQPLVLSDSLAGCRVETVEDIPGQVCELRRISGQVASSDMRFLLNAKLPYAVQQQARYQVGNTWYPLGTSIPLTELAKGQQLSLFVPQTDNATTEVSAVQAELYSPQNRVQRIMIAMTTPLSPGANTVPAQQLVVVEDKPTGKTLFATQESAMPRLSRAPGVTVAGGAMPLLGLIGQPGAKITSITPQQWQAADMAKQSASQQPLSTDAVSQLLQTGQLQGQVNVALPTGATATYPLHISAEQRLVLSESGTPCMPETVNGVAGQVCEWRQVSGEINQSDLRFRVTAPPALKQPILFKVGDNWHPLGSDIAITEFAGKQSLSLFIPDMQDAELTNQEQVNNLITAEFYSTKRIDKSIKFDFNLSDLNLTPMAVSSIETSADTFRLGEPVTVTVKLKNIVAGGTRKSYLYISPNDYQPEAVKLLVSNPIGAKFTGNSRVEVDEGVSEFSFQLSSSLDTTKPRTVMIRIGDYVFLGPMTRQIMLMPKDDKSEPLFIRTVEVNYPDGYALLQAGSKFNINVKLNRPANGQDESIYIGAPFREHSHPYDSWYANKLLDNKLVNITNADYVEGSFPGEIKVSVHPGKQDVSFGIKVKSDIGVASHLGRIYVTHTHYNYTDIYREPFMRVDIRIVNPSDEKLSVVDFRTDNPVHDFPTNGYGAGVFIGLNNATRIYVKLNRPARAGDNQVEIYLSTGWGGSLVGGVQPHAITNEVLYTTPIPISGTDQVLELPKSPDYVHYSNKHNWVTVHPGVQELYFDLIPLEVKSKLRLLHFGAPDSTRLYGYIGASGTGDIPLKVQSITPDVQSVLPGNKVVYTVRLNQAASGGEPVNLKFFNGTADIADLASSQITAVTGATPVTADIAMGAQVKMEAGRSEFTFTVQTKPDEDTADQDFTIRASESTVTQSSPSANVVIKGKQQGDLEVLYVYAYPPVIGENEFTKIVVTLSRPAIRGEALFIKRSGGDAAPDAVDEYVADPQGIDGFGFNATGATAAIRENYREVTFQLKALKSAEVNKKFDVFAKVNGAADATAKTETVTISSQTPTDEAKVTQVSMVGGNMLIAGGPGNRLVVQLDKKVTKKQPVFVKFDGKGSADISDLTSRKMEQVSCADVGTDFLDDGLNVMVSEGCEQFSFMLTAASDSDYAIETFDIRAKEGWEDDPAAKFTTIYIAPNVSPSAPAKVVKLEASPQDVEAGKVTRIGIVLDKPAMGTEQIYIQMKDGTTTRADIVLPAITDSSRLTGATGMIPDLYYNGLYLTAEKDATRIEFDLTMAKDDDKIEETFSVLAQDARATDDTSPYISVNIQPQVMLPPEVGFTNGEPPKYGPFDINAPDINFSYGIQLVNYVPSPVSNSKDSLEKRLLSALSVHVDVSDIKTYNAEGRDYCAFETDDEKLVPFPFFLKQENGTETSIDCLTSKSLLLSPPDSWGSHSGTTYNTTLNARVVMGDKVSQSASGMAWHGNATLNGTLTINMQVN